MRVSKARRMRRFIEALADHLKDEEAVEAPELFRKWNNEHSYGKGQRVRYEGLLYRCLQSHDAQPGWNPVDAPNLWAGVIALREWMQPGKENPYQKGERVIHSGKVWVSLYDNNSEEPGVSGWEEVS